MSLEKAIPYDQLPPVQRGWVRGLLRGLVEEAELTEYGQGRRWRFKVVPDDGKEPVDVEMNGLDCVGHLVEDSLVDVYVGGTKKRPVRTNYLWAPTVEGAVMTFYPGQPTPKHPGEAAWKEWLIPTSFAFAAALVAVGAILLLWQR